MNERARRILHDVRNRMLNARGDADPEGGHLLAVRILLPTTAVGTEPLWTPSEEHVELVPGELWARPTATPELYDVVAAPHARQQDGHLVLISGTVTLTDLMGCNGVYDRPHLLENYVTGTAVRTGLPDNHPLHARHRHIEQLWDELVWQCQYNWLEPLDESCPPMPSLNRLADGTWQIGLLLRIGVTGTWDEDDDLHSRFLAGLFDAYPLGKTVITAYVPDPCYPSTPAWQRLGIAPQMLTARELDSDPDSDLPF
jgi:hypothetical protein